MPSLLGTNTKSPTLYWGLGPSAKQAEAIKNPAELINLCFISRIFISNHPLFLSDHTNKNFFIYLSFFYLYFFGEDWTFHIRPRAAHIPKSNFILSQTEPTATHPTDNPCPMDQTETKRYFFTLVNLRSNFPQNPIKRPFRAIKEYQSLGFKAPRGSRIFQWTEPFLSSEPVAGLCLRNILIIIIKKGKEKRTKNFFLKLKMTWLRKGRSKHRRGVKNKSQAKKWRSTFTP